MITVHAPNREDRILPIPAQGCTLLSILREAGVFPSAPCGGTGRCGNCRVRAIGGLSAPDAEECRLLGTDALQRDIRLACRAKINGEAVEVWIDAPVIVAAPMKTISNLVPVNPLGERIGLAVDLGTTTIAGALYDLKSGILLAKHTVRNPQTAYGADVISRLQAARTQAQALTDSAKSAIRTLTHDLLAKANRQELPDAAVLTANTAMLCLLFGYPVRSLSRAPFALPHAFGETLPLSVLLPDAEGTLYVPPCIGPFLGADLVTALLDTDLMRMNCPTALLDLGTNGEIALFDGHTLACCSTAAGPAFEGAGIRMGCSASTGAIDRVTLSEHRLVCHTVGGAAAVGLCGSGLLDAIACLLETGEIDANGKLASDDCVYLGGTQIALYQQDIRAVQSAKAAIRAGLDMLCENRGIDSPTLLLAGGFGGALNTKSASRIGLIPQDASARTRSVGNAALQGAAKLLMDRRLQNECRDIAASAVMVDLAANPLFTERYIEQMKF